NKPHGPEDEPFEEGSMSPPGVDRHLWCRFGGAGAHRRRRSTSEENLVMSPIATHRRRQPAPRVRPAKSHVHLETLEDRTLWAVGLGMNFPALAFGPGDFVPPDTGVAAGTCLLMETVNSTVAWYDKATGLLVRQQPLATLFVRPAAGGFVGNP